jgi:hypothetical protein
MAADNLRLQRYDIFDIFVIHDIQFETALVLQFAACLAIADHDNHQGQE